MPVKHHGSAPTALLHRPRRTPQFRPRGGRHGHHPAGLQPQHQGLEQELGCQLVDRGSKDLRPTPEGQVVLQHALSLVQGSANLIHEIAQLNKLDAGELRFGSGPAPAQQLVPDAVADFINRHPRVQISLDVDNWEKLSRSCSAKRSNSSSPTSATSRPTRTSRRAR